VGTSDRIGTICRKCGKVGEVRGITVTDLVDGIKGFKYDGKAVPVTCAPCRFRESQKEREMSPIQKESRKEYNRTRNEETKLARQLYRDIMDGRVKIGSGS
jgi:hypothetical protein